MAFAELRALHALLGRSLAELEHIYSSASASLHPDSDPNSKLDFPAPDTPYDADAPAEVLARRPDAARACARIVAAAGQLAARVRDPFLAIW
jgi:outer membrane protein TolC